MAAAIETITPFFFVKNILNKTGNLAEDPIKWKSTYEKEFIPIIIKKALCTTTYNLQLISILDNFPYLGKLAQYKYLYGIDFDDKYVKWNKENVAKKENQDTLKGFFALFAEKEFTNNEIENLLQVYTEKEIKEMKSLMNPTQTKRNATHDQTQ